MIPLFVCGSSYSLHMKHVFITVEVTSLELNYAPVTSIEEWSYKPC
jgi:hypothetical protein